MTDKITKREAQRLSRSARYQYNIVELPVGNLLDMVPLKDHEIIIQSKFQSLTLEEDEHLHDLKDKLISRMLYLMKKLSANQRKVLTLYYLKGFTQQEIGDKLKIRQSSVYHIIHGSDIYKLKNEILGRDKKRIHGGALKKFSKIMSEDKKLNLILKELIEYEYLFPPRNYLCWKMIEEENDLLSV